MVADYNTHSFLPGIKKFLKENEGQEEIKGETLYKSEQILNPIQSVSYEDLTGDQQRIVDDYNRGLYQEFESGKINKEKQNEIKKRRLNKNDRVILNNYESYEIELEEGQVKTIKFYFKKEDQLYGFEIVIKDYNFFSENLNDRYGGSYLICNVKDIILGKIGKKLKSGYEYKDNINYFKYLGLDCGNLKKFIEQVILNYHKNFKKDI